MVRHYAHAGSLINGTAQTMVFISKKRCRLVVTEFNGILLAANQHTTAQDIVAFYNKESQRRSDAYVNSPEYRARQREAELAQQRHALMLEGALAVAPEKMALKDPEAWQKFVETNSDGGYGQAILNYAELWARLMEGRITNGDTIEGCADQSSHLANTEGITGFMYGIAVSVLSTFWVYGEELRRWHNLKTQLGTEGERANEEGGVLNPALLSIG